MCSVAGHSGPAVGFSLSAVFIASSLRRSLSVPKPASRTVVKLATMVLSGTHGPIALSGYPRGTRVRCETTCPRHTAPNLPVETRSRTRVSREPDGTARENPQHGADSINDTQAVCGFRYWASKHTPFFHTIKTIVAIFLAKVSRAISGRMPLASKPA
jgi:hypothetical protein